MDYRKALDIQNETHSRVLNKIDLETVLVVEHPDVITLGKRGGAVLEGNHGDIPIIQTDRGGLATCHNFGQLVLYPIINIKYREIGVQKFICVLLKAIKNSLLRMYNVEVVISSSQTGLWYQDKKIASIGMRIKKGVSMHGIAINIYNDLSLFHRIEPCGFSSHSMTNLISIDGISSQIIPNSSDQLMKLGKEIAVQLIENIEEERKDY